MSVTIPEYKLQEIRDLARVWTYKKTATKRELQVLAGKLLHVSHCVLPARKFMCRVLALLASAPQTGAIKVDSETRRDVKWFVDYAEGANGRLLISPTYPEVVLECDACLEGAGGFSALHYYSFRFPERDTENRHISQLEAINIVVALKSLVPPTLRHHSVKLCIGLCSQYWTYARLCPGSLLQGALAGSGYPGAQNYHRTRPR